LNLYVLVNVHSISVSWISCNYRLYNCQKILKVGIILSKSV